MDLERVDKTKNKKKASNESDYQMQKKLKSLQNKQSKIEVQIADLEKEIKAIDLELQINYEVTIAQPNFFDHYNKKKELLAESMLRWEAVLEELMELES